MQPFCDIGHRSARKNYTHVQNDPWSNLTPSATGHPFPGMESAPPSRHLNLHKLNPGETFLKPQFTILMPSALSPEGFSHVGLRGPGLISGPPVLPSASSACYVHLRGLSMTRLNHDHRRILLIDHNRTKQNLRATILRNYEIEVHTAGDFTGAAALWARYFYDLVLLAAPENSEEAVAVSAQIRQVHPRQRIGLLVGPPVFVRELGGVRREPARRKAASIGTVLRDRGLESPTLPVPAPHTSSPPASAPQWQEMIRKLVTDWYANSSALVGLPKLTGRIADA
jgi:CheY-like chemotaxis protein